VEAERDAEHVARVDAVARTVESRAIIQDILTNPQMGTALRSQAALSERMNRLV